MGDILLPGFDQVRGNTRSNVDYRIVNAPWRLVLHTVEGDPSSKASMRYVAEQHRYGPHLWVSPRLQYRIQTVPLNKTAFALLHPSGTQETNHMKAVQVEQFGFAGQTHDWDDSWADWIGEHVIAPVHLALGGALNLDYVERTYGAGDGIVLATSASPIRHSYNEWAGCNWVTSHQRIRYNDHWDCGKFKLGRALAAARETVGNPGPVDPLPPTTDEGEITVSEADRIIQHFDNNYLKDMQARTDAIAALVQKSGAQIMSYLAENQKTAILYRVAGTAAPWYGLVGGKVVGPLNVDQAVDFKRQHEITENSIEISQEWHDLYSKEFGVVTVSDESVEDIASAVSDVNAQLLNGLPGGAELAQSIAQQVLAQLGSDVTSEVLEAISEALSQAADDLR